MYNPKTHKICPKCQKEAKMEDEFCKCGHMFTKGCPISKSIKLALDEMVPLDDVKNREHKDWAFEYESEITTKVEDKKICMFSCPFKKGRKLGKLCVRPDKGEYDECHDEYPVCIAKIVKTTKMKRLMKTGREEEKTYSAFEYRMFGNKGGRNGLEKD